MNIKRTLSAGFFIISLSVCAQDLNSKKNTLQPPASNAERYKQDYEIKGWTSIQDSAKVKALNLDHFDSQRDAVWDKEIFDHHTGLTVIVYSVQKTTQKKQ